MAENFDKPRIVLTLIKTSILLIAIIACFFCGTETKQNTEDSIAFTIDSKTRKTSWDEIFSGDTVLTFKNGNEDYELISITGLVVNSKGEYIVFDGRMGKVIHFDHDLNFIRIIGGNGGGPGEYQIAHSPSLDASGNLYLCDFGQMRINRYNAPDYAFHSQIKLGYPVRDMIAGPDGNVTMYLGQGEYALKKVDVNGQVINRGFKIEDEMFNLFLARFNLGRISPIDGGDAFLFFYPDEYRIYLMDYNYTPILTYYTDKPSRFLPGKLKFPRNLSPYDFTPSHSKWWSSSLHPAFIHYLGRGFFMVEVFEYEKLSEKTYFNIHNLNGVTVAEGIEFPHNGRIIFARNGYIYFVERPTLNDKDEETPLRLHRYELKLLGGESNYLERVGKLTNKK